MKRLINIIEQDAAIWELSKEEVEFILSKGIHNKVCELETYKLSEEDMIVAWAESFREVIKILDANIIPYNGINRFNEFTWMKENPNSFIRGL